MVRALSFFLASFIVWRPANGDQLWVRVGGVSVRWSGVRGEETGKIGVM